MFIYIYLDIRRNGPSFVVITISLFVDVSAVVALVVIVVVVVAAAAVDVNLLASRTDLELKSYRATELAICRANGRMATNKIEGSRKIH